MLSHILLYILFFHQISTCTSQIKIDGGWTGWSNIKSNCREKLNAKKFVKCGGGVRTKYRSCNNPEPANGGEPCKGQEEVQVPCNTHFCQMTVSKIWSEWSSCSKSCGLGTRKRVKMCGLLRTGEGSKSEVVYSKECALNQYDEMVEPCDSWDMKLCPSPCLNHICPELAVCIDNSTQEGGKDVSCACQLGTVMKDDGTSCIVPPSSQSDIPLSINRDNSLAWISSVSAIIVIILLLIILILFITKRNFESARIIHMNIELALLFANIVLLPGFVQTEAACRFLSIANHFFYSAAFIFMFLESIYFYSLIAWVVPKDGLLKSYQNVCIGWFSSGLLVLMTMCFEYINYGGNYHCWLRMNDGIVYAAFFPIIILYFLILIVIEASGSSSSYSPLSKIDEEQRESAKAMKKSMLLILHLLLGSYIFGCLANYNQSLSFTWLFAVFNILMGLAVVILHGLNDRSLQTKLNQRSNKVNAEK